MTELLPLFLNLHGRAVLLVGGGPVATAKLRQLLAVGARVHIVAPEVSREIEALVAESATPQADVTLSRRAFVAADLDDVWLVVAAATPDANAQVAELAEAARIFVNAVDDPANASAFLSGVVRRDGVTLAISTTGHAPALTSLLREALDAVLPCDLAAWVWRARAERIAWRRDEVPMDARKPMLLRALNALYEEEEKNPEGAEIAENKKISAHAAISAVVSARGPRVPWLSGPEDSWL